LMGKVNAESGYIGDVSFGPNQLRIHNIAGSRQFYSGGFYWDVTYEFDVDPNSEAGFRDVLDQGTYYLDSSGDRINFTDDDGELSERTRKLDGDGGPLPVGSSPVFLTYRTRSLFLTSELGIFTTSATPI